MAQSFVPYVHSDGKTWEFYFVDPSSSVIYFIKSHNGKKIKFTTKEKTPDGVKAKRYANEEFDRRIGRKQRHVRTLVQDEIKAWLLLKESEGHKYDTMNNIRRAAKQIEEFWGKQFPNEITRDSFAEWCAWWRVNHPDIQMENAIKYFNNFCAYLHEKLDGDRPLLPSKLRFKDPNRFVNEAKRDLKKERVFTYEEFVRIHSTAVNDVEALLVHFLYTMGSRVDETLKLDFNRILLDREVPAYRWSSGTNKAKKVGENAIHLSLIEPFRKLRERRKAEGTTLYFPQQMDNQKSLREQQVDWSDWRVRADLGWHWTSHTFKHTCLTNLFNDPKNPQAVICKLYRTSLQTALKHYVKVTQESVLAMRESIEVKL